MSLDISVVIPVYNEAQNLEELHRELTLALESGSRTYELIFIDDGSSDSSFNILSKLHAIDDHVFVLRLRKNFGQTAAFAAGFARASGDAVVTIDADLQNDPNDIPMMLDKLSDGNDIVCGWRKDRKDPWLTRRIPSMIANWLISVTTGVRLHDYGCSLKALRVEVVKPLRLYGELHRFIPAIASQQGVLVTELIVNHRARRFGRSKYGLSRTIRVLFDLITVKFLLSFSTRPLQIFGPLGFMLMAIGFCLTAYLGYIRLFEGQPISGRPMLLLGILMAFSGLQLVTLGLLAELQARTYHESQGKPIYVIRDVLEGRSDYDSQVTST
jgi:glycosyltransferase involved in cell wall biosynthesis